MRLGSLLPAFWSELDNIKEAGLRDLASKAVALPKKALSATGKVYDKAGQKALALMVKHPKITGLIHSQLEDAESVSRGIQSFLSHS